MASLRELQKKLGREFYLNNLYDMAKLCSELALDCSSPAPFFVMRHIFLDIAGHFQGRPLSVREAKLTKDRVVGPIEDLIEGIRAEAASEEILALLNDVVSAYLSEPI